MSRCPRPAGRSGSRRSARACPGWPRRCRRARRRRACRDGAGGWRRRVAVTGWARIVAISDRWCLHACRACSPTPRSKVSPGWIRADEYWVVTGSRRILNRPSMEQMVTPSAPTVMARANYCHPRHARANLTGGADAAHVQPRAYRSVCDQGLRRSASRERPRPQDRRARDRDRA